MHGLVSPDGDSAFFRWDRESACFLFRLSYDYRQHPPLPARELLAGYVCGIAFQSFSLTRTHAAYTSLLSRGLYVLGTLFVFTTALYLAVYMANYIAVRLKKTEEAYRQTNIMLQEKDRIKDEYVFRVTHDIKGHLATIQSCLAIVVEGHGGEIRVTRKEGSGTTFTIRLPRGRASQAGEVIQKDVCN